MKTKALWRTGDKLRTKWTEKNVVKYSDTGGRKSVINGWQGKERLLRI